AFLYANGLAIAQTFAVDRKPLIPDFPPVRLFLLLLEFLRFARHLGIYVAFRHLFSPEERLKFVGRQKHLLIVMTGVVLGLNVDERKLSRVGAAVHIRHRHHMGVHETGSRRLRRQLIPDMAMGGGFKALLFSRPVYGRRDNLTIPVDELRRVRIVEQIDGRGDALAKTDEGSRDSSVVSESADGVTFCDIRQYRAYAQCEIGWATKSGLFKPRH